MAIESLDKGKGPGETFLVTMRAPRKELALLLGETRTIVEDWARFDAVDSAAEVFPFREIDKYLRLKP